MITVNLARLSLSAHSCTSDHGISNFSSSLMVGPSTAAAAAAAADDGDVSSQLPAKLVAEAVILIGDALPCLTKLVTSEDTCGCDGAPSLSRRCHRLLAALDWIILCVEKESTTPKRDN